MDCIDGARRGKNPPAVTVVAPVFEPQAGQASPPAGSEMFPGHVVRRSVGGPDFGPVA